MAEPMRIDVHQHVWTRPLLQALSARHRLPFVRQSHGLTVLHSAGERPYVIDLEAESPAHRAGLLRSDHLDLALVALSSPIGIEALARAQARALIDAHLTGVAELGPSFAAWGPIGLDRPEPRDVDEMLTRGCVGISLPAPALATPEALQAIGPVLERVAAHEVPLFVHPGAGFRTAEASLGDPLWWRALTDYVAQMQSAWLTFCAIGRREHPDLTVIFAMLAAGAPLLSERLETRGGPPVDIRDPLTFYDTSSYGPTAIEAMARRVGSDQLVYGSDRPVIEPMPSGRERLLQMTPSRLLGDGAAVRSREPAAVGT